MKIRYITAQLLIALTVLGSCKKLVDAGDPLTTITAEKTFSRDGSAYAALSGLYSLLMNGNSPYQQAFGNGAMTIYPGLSGDELTGLAGVDNETDYNFTVNRLESRNIVVKDVFWSPIYKLVFNANSVIEGVASSTSNQLTPAARKQINAESRFIRAFCYFYLTNLFGDVPLVSGTDWKVNAGLPRAPAAEVYALMINDLLEAQRDLPDSYGFVDGQRIRANKFAATALLARVYLYNRDWKNAASQASLVIASPQYALETDLDKVFNANNSESIWQLKPSAVSEHPGLYEAENFTPLLWWRDFPEADRPFYLDVSIFPDLVGFLYPRYYFTQQLSAAFETGDKRLDHWTSFVDTPTYPPYTGVTDRFPVKYLPNANGTAKYPTLIRLAEVFLIRAEARAQTGDLAGADADLNKVRARAGLPGVVSASQALALDAVAHERRTELFGEWGHRWFDLKRTGKALEALRLVAGKQVIAAQLLYPIPFDEISVAPNLKQNPGY